MLQTALEYASWGFSVFPLKPNSKIPATPNGVKDATKDANEIRALWLRYPNANIGVALGAPSGVVAIDLDKGATEETLNLFPRTVTVRTKNGWHLYFRWREGIGNCQFAKEGFHATVRSTGYYVVGCGSVVDGHEYAWANSLGGDCAWGEVELAELPAEIAEKCSKKVYGENGRHEMFKATAVAMRAKGHDKVAVLAELHRRNLEDCNPPKPDVDKELENIVEWAFKTVAENPAQVQAEQNKQAAKERKARRQHGDEYLIPLGFEDSEYFYTSSSNKQIVKLNARAHREYGLVQLMPLTYWQAKYPKGDEGAVNWLKAASDLMEDCRDQGKFDFRKVRGLGCWMHKGGVVVHLGDRLWHEGREIPLNAFEADDRHIYELQTICPSPSLEPATDAECAKLLAASGCLQWRDASSAVFFAGAMSILRICGALKWRPMVWLTGSTGTGKSTLMERVVQNIAGRDGIYILGNTTEAGIRQRIKASAQPVIYDEAETTDKRSSTRMQAVLELIRQASSDSAAQILKGTADGRGHAYKINAMFVLSSIQVNLKNAQDLNRFTVLELNRGEPGNWPEVNRKLSNVDEQLGNKIYARMLLHYATLKHNQEVFEECIAEIADRRTAQQYSVLLAGYSMLSSVEKIEHAVAAELVKTLGVFGAIKEEKHDTEQENECLHWLKSSMVRISISNDKQEIDMGMLIQKASGNVDYKEALNMLGVDVDNEYVYTCSSHPALSDIFRGTPWENSLWNRTLSRLPGAVPSVRRRIRHNRTRATSIPVKYFFQA
jgi:hypothetical protein